MNRPTFLTARRFGQRIAAAFRGHPVPCWTEYLRETRGRDA